MYNARMKKIDSYYTSLSVKNTAKKIRAQHPEALLGFLGNSLGVLAVADCHDVFGKQRIIPFSNAQPGAYVRPCYERDGEHGFDLTGMYHIHQDKIHERFEMIFGETDVSPKNVIANNAHLVIVDRVWDGKCLAAFGFFWNNLAKRQGCERKAAQHIAFCAVNKKNDAKAWQSFTIQDRWRSKEILYRVNVGVIEDMDAQSCGEIFDLDDYGQMERLSPRLDLCSAEKIDKREREKALNAIVDYYRDFASDVTGREPSKETAQVKTASLLIGA